MFFSSHHSFAEPDIAGIEVVDAATYNKIIDIGTLGFHSFLPHALRLFATPRSFVSERRKNSYYTFTMAI